MTDPEDDERLRAWSELVAVYQSVLHDVVRALEDDGGLDSGVYSALAHLARSPAPGRLRLAELQALMHPRYSQPGLSRLVQRMEADGLVERSVDPADGRATVLSTTRAGRARFRRAHAVYTGSLREQFGRHLSVAQARALKRALRPLIERRAIGRAPSRTVPGT